VNMRRPMVKALKDSPAPDSFGTSPLREARPRRAVWGLFDRRERWSLSWRGRLILIFAVLLSAGFLFKEVYPFLATTHRVDADVLVVEGWMHEYAIRAAVEEFRSGSYRCVFATGGPVEGNGGYTNDFQTAASVAADLLRKAGVPDESLQMVPSRVMDRDRTYGSAIALRNWFHQHNMPVSGIEIITEDLHARRSRLLFQKALGNNVTIGVIAVPNPDYDSKHWWRYSQGVRDVLGEGIAYLYARFLFYPSVSSPGDKRAGTSQASR
jgi:uncharacterized SAM-binding protein YcdF (DUF218 family)